MAECSQFDLMMKFVTFCYNNKRFPSYLVAGYIIKKLFKSKKHLYGFQLIQRFLGDLLDPHPAVQNGLPVRVYEDIMSALSDGRFNHYVHHLYRNCRTYGFTRTATMCNIMMATYLQMGNIDKALLISNHLQQIGGGEMTSQTARQFIIALKKKNPQDAQDFINNLFLCGKMDVVLYKTAIQNHLTLPGLSTPQEIFIHMIQNGIQADRMLFMVWMKRLHHFERDLAELEELLNLSKEFFPLNAHTYNFMIKVYLDYDLLPKALEFLEEMQDNGIVADRYTYTTFLSYFLAKKDMAQALKYYGKLIGYDFESKEVTYLSDRERAGGDVVHMMLRDLSISEKSKLLYITVRCGLRPANTQLFETLLDLLPENTWTCVLIPELRDERFRSILLEKCLDRKWTFSLKDIHQKMLEDWSSMPWSAVHYDLTHKAKLGHPFDTYVLLRSIAKRMHMEIPHEIDLSTRKVVDDFLNRFHSMDITTPLPVWKRPLPQYRKVGRPDVGYQEEIEEIMAPLLEPKPMPRVETVSTIASEMLPVLHTAVALYKDIKRKKQ
jgi:pentatricopeptide repeat protein